MGAERIARALGGAQRSGTGWVCRCCCHEDRRPSLSLRDGEGGRLLVQCFAGCDSVQILRELQERGLDEAPDRNADRPAPRPRPDQDRNAEIARRVFDEARPAPGTLVEEYLRNRGYEGEIPPALRFHPRCLHKPTGQSFPAMLAAIARPDGTLGGIQRTWLTAARPVRKAPLASNKMSLGSCVGGAVQLAPAEATLTVCEGIENGLSLMCASGLPAWASCGTEFLKRMILPPLPLAALVIIGADADAPGEAAAQEAAQRWLAEGRRVRIARPPAGMDWNDVLMHGAGASIEEGALAGQ